jgi:hypothetical protein
VDHVTEHDLDVMWTNLSIQVSMWERHTSGKTSTDLINWRAELMRDVRFGYRISQMLEEIAELDE